MMWAESFSRLEDERFIACPDGYEVWKYELQIRLFNSEVQVGNSAVIVDAKLRGLIWLAAVVTDSSFRLLCIICAAIKTWR